MTNHTTDNGAARALRSVPMADDASDLAPAAASSRVRRAGMPSDALNDYLAGRAHLSLRSVAARAHAGLPDPAVEDQVVTPSPANVVPLTSAPSLRRAPRLRVPCIRESDTLGLAAALRVRGFQIFEITGNDVVVLWSGRIDDAVRIASVALVGGHSDPMALSELLEAQMARSLPTVY